MAHHEEGDFKDPFNLKYLLLFLVVFIGILLPPILGWMLVL